MNYIKKIISVFTIIAIIFSITGSISVYAADTYSLQLITKFDNKYLRGVNMDVYLIATLTPNGKNFAPQAAFASRFTGQDLAAVTALNAKADDVIKFCENLEAFISSTSFRLANAVRLQGYTDSNGELFFGNLTPGVYFVQQRGSAVTIGDSTYSIQSLIIPVPYTDFEGVAVTSAIIQPKISQGTTTTSGGGGGGTTTTSGSGGGGTTTSSGGGQPPTHTTTTETPPQTHTTTTETPTTTQTPTHTTTEAPTHIPATTIPETHIPVTTVPETHIPATTVPETHVLQPPTETQPTIEEVTIPDNRVPLGNGWSAEYDADNDYWIIYDDNGVPIGIIYLPPGEDIRDYPIEENLIPFDNIGFTEEATTGRTILSIIKNNPITGDNIFGLVGILVVSALGVFYIIYRKRKKDRDNGTIK